MSVNRPLVDSVVSLALIGRLYIVSKSIVGECASLCYEITGVVHLVLSRCLNVLIAGDKTPWGALLQSVSRRVKLGDSQKHSLLLLTREPLHVISLLRQHMFSSPVTCSFSEFLYQLQGLEFHLGSSMIVSRGTKILLRRSNFLSSHVPLVVFPNDWPSC